MTNLKLEKWYIKKEPTTQIEILKTIALKGFQSKSNLSKLLNSKITTIDTIVGKMEDSKHDLLQRVKVVEITKGKTKHILFSLTDKSIKILLSNQYEENNKPYLNSIECREFFSKYELDYINQIKQDVVDTWHKPKSQKQELQEFYIKSNPTLYKEFQPESKIGKLRKKIKELDLELTQAMVEFVASQSKNK